MIHSLPVLFFFLCEGLLTQTNSTFLSQGSPQWLSELRWQWLNVPWQIACELACLIGSHDMLGQYRQPTLTSLGQGCTCVQV